MSETRFIKLRIRTNGKECSPDCYFLKTDACTLFGFDLGPASPYQEGVPLTYLRLEKCIEYASLDEDTYHGQKNHE